MLTLADLAVHYPCHPYYHLLYVGGDPGKKEAVQAEVERFGEVRASRWVASPDEAERLFAEGELHVGKYEGCLLVFWTVDETAPPQHDAGLDVLPRYLGSAQAIGFVVTRADPALSLRGLIDLIGRDFAFIGPFETCLEAVRTWCGPPVPGSKVADLRLPYRKRPSRWVRDLKHDYIVNGSLAQPFRSVLEAHGLWELQREIDLLQNVLSNLLCFPWSENVERAIPPTELSEASSLYRQVYSGRRCRIVAPAALAAVLEIDCVEGEDLTLYASEEAIPGQLESAARDGFAPILLRAPEARLPAGWEGIAKPFRVPTLLVSSAPYRVGPNSWRASLADNVVGSYTQAELESLSGRSTVVAAKRSFWRLCTHLTLAEVFDHLIDRFVTTYEGLGEADENLGLREQVFRSLAMVWSAKGLYCAETTNGVRT